MTPLTPLLLPLPLLLLLLLGLTTASSTYKPCTSPSVRREWRTLSATHQKSYIAAVLCLQSTPGKYIRPFPGLERTTLYEDFVYLHKIEAPYIHFTSEFLTWHRYYLHAYDAALRKCGYAGPTPYWDQSLDSGSRARFLSSPIFSAAAFGGNGLVPSPAPPANPGFPPDTGGGCISDGPFKDYTVRLANNSTLAVDPRCLMRSLNPMVAAYWSTRQREAEVLAIPTYTQFVLQLEGIPGSVETMGMHGGGHASIGGRSGNGDFYISPSDPLFFLHHANVDRIWVTWQDGGEGGNRTYWIEGSHKPRIPYFSPDPEMIPEGDVELGFRIGLGVIAGKRTVRELMDTKGGFLCYMYQKPPEVVVGVV